MDAVVRDVYCTARVIETFATGSDTFDQGSGPDMAVNREDKPSVQDSERGKIASEKTKF